MTRLTHGALGATVFFALAATPAASHITLETPNATPRAGYKAVLRVTHGCDGQPTIAIAVKIPEGVIAAKPMSKAGWTIEITKGAYAKSYAFYHGSTLDKGATAITWKGGSLPDDMYDEFVVAAYISDAFKPGTSIAFPVEQTCAAGKSLSWTEVPKAGQDAHELKAPAPLLRITGDGQAPPTHHH